MRVSPTDPVVSAAGLLRTVANSCQMRMDAEVVQQYTEHLVSHSNVERLAWKHRTSLVKAMTIESDNLEPRLQVTVSTRLFLQKFTASRIA